MKKIILAILALLLFSVPCSGALEYTTSDQYVGLGDVDSLEGLSAFTFCGWIYLASTNADRILISKGVGTGNIYFVWFDDTASVSGRTDVFSFGLNTGSFYRVEGNTENRTAGEYWICATWDGTTMNLYVNNVFDGSTNTSGSMSTNTDPIRFGTQSDGSGAFNGKQWDFRMYNRTLSTAERAIIYYSRGNDNIVDGLLGRWLMNEKPDGTAASGSNTVIDISGNNNSGTPYNSPVYRGSPSTITNPQFN